MTTIRWRCQACGLDAPHRARSDNGMPRAACVACEAARAKRWRRERWARRKAYDTWRGIVRRCHDPDQGRTYGPGTPVPRYADYGARGVTVCRRWRDPARGFERFVSDMGLPPSKDHTLDRIRCGRGYSPSNCRWAHPDVQRTNRRNVRWVTAPDPETGEELTLCLSGWARRTGVGRRTIARRLDRGWDPAVAVLSGRSRGCPF